jgi:CubicO group peptidase (beta-lactamase class C family)
VTESGNRLLAETARAVDAQVAAAQAAGRVPTLVVGVVRGGELVHLADAGDPVGPDTQFRLGSITKTMTATIALQLRDEGRLSLDDLLYRHLPGTAVGGVTLRQLLGHVSGMQREPDGPWWERAPGVDLDRLLAEVTPDKLAHPPYRSHHYSNLGYGLLGAVLQRITGLSWAAMVDERLLRPLGLKRTSYHPAEPFARGYVVHPWHGTLQEQPRHDSGAMAPAGQLWSTVGDLARWAGFLADPDPAVLAPATLAEMCAPVAIVDPQRWTAGHGLGLALRRHGERVFVGHTGSMPGYLAVLAVHRPSGTAVVGFANAYTLHSAPSSGFATPHHPRSGTTIEQLAAELLATVLDREPAPPAPWRPASPPAPAVAPLCGRWWWMGQEYEVSAGAGAGELVVTPLTCPAALAGPLPGPPATPAGANRGAGAEAPASAAEPWRFVPDGVDRWRGTTGTNDGEMLVVRHDPAGAVAALEIATFEFTRDPAQRDGGEQPPEHVRLPA